MEYHKEKRKNETGRRHFRERRPDETSAAAPETVVAGRNAVRELLNSGRDIDKIYVARGEHEGSIRQLIGLATERKLPLIEVERTKLDVLSGGSAHQGIVAIAAEQNYISVSEILDYAAFCEEPPFVVICDGIEDPHNLGAIIRSAECAGVHGVIIPKRRAVGLTATVAKASAGALEHMRVAKVTNIAMTIEELKEKGFWIYAADMDGTAVYDTDFSGPIAVVLGNEGDGISRLVKEKCDFTVSVPMYGQVNSLNVSCAAAVVLSVAAQKRHKK